MCHEERARSGDRSAYFLYYHFVLSLSNEPTCRVALDSTSVSMTLEANNRCSLPLDLLSETDMHARLIRSRRACAQGSVLHLLHLYIVWHPTVALDCRR